jgi:DNA-binding NarL/FixJ family response regulator
MKKRYNIILADDHPILREGLKKLISEDPELHVIGEAGNGHVLMDILDHGMKADLVILDMSMPEMDGLRTMEDLRMRYPKIRILVLTMHDDQEYFKQGIRFGIDGYILKEDVYESLISAVKKIRAGERAFSPRMSDRILENIVHEIENVKVPDNEPQFSERETEILVQVAKGFTSKQIADNLEISQRTVEAHRARIMNKLDVNNIAGLVKYAVQKELI